MSKNRCIIGLVIYGFFCLGASFFNVTTAKVWHVCMDCEERDTRTIGEAVRQAAPRDTILVYWEPRYPYYMEKLVIDKPLRLISYAAAGDILDYDLYPVLTATGKEIIHIAVPGVELIGFNIMYLQKPEPIESDTEFLGRVGIRLSAPALIRSCGITNCSTGIYADYGSYSGTQGSRIQLCRIGLPPDHGLNRKGLSQTVNYFGMVLMGSHPVGVSARYASDHVADCQIMRNNQYGIVYTPRNKPIMENNIVELNGQAPFRIAQPTLAPDQTLLWIEMAVPTAPVTLPPSPAVPSDNQ